MKKIKIEINNNISPRTYLIIFIFSLVMFICSFVVSVKYYIDIKDYVKVNATIIESGYRYIGPSSEESKIDYIKVKYEYKNNEYIKELRVNVLLIYPKVGSNRTILINPNNPEEVDNHYIRVLCLIASVLLLIFNLFVFNAYRIRKKQVS